MTLPRDVIELSALRLVEIVNESLQIAASTKDANTMRSRIRLARQKFDELRALAREFTFLSMKNAEAVESDIRRLELQATRGSSTPDAGTAPADGEFRALLGPEVRPAVLSDAQYPLRGLVEDGICYLFRRREDYVDGRHYTEYGAAVKQLKAAKRYEEAERLLLAICDAVERGPLTPPPWYFEQLAIIYRKQKRRDDEIAILRRFLRKNGAPEGAGGRLERRVAKL